MKQEMLPTLVSERTKQVGESELHERWSWVEPVVWNTRMLQALEQGVKGGVWYSLIDKVFSAQNLSEAWRKVKAKRGSAGVDHVTVAMFAQRLEQNISCLSQELRDSRYRPQAIRRVYIPKPGSAEERPLGIPTVRDRVVQRALLNVLEPIFEKEFGQHSYGFRPGRSCKDALRRVDGLLKAGYQWVVDVDLKSYFDTIPSARLMAEIRHRVADRRVLDLLDLMLQQRVLEGASCWVPEKGTPQGAVISPLLANIYLNPLDHLMAEQGMEMVRYADDLVILCRSEDEARHALVVVGDWVQQAQLTLHATKTRIVDFKTSDGFDFLGYHFQLIRKKPGKIYRWPRKKSLNQFKDRVRELTKRTNGNSLAIIAKCLDPVIRGFFEYFKQSNGYTFEALDKWIRMRLRSILRRRIKLRGRGRGYDHNRWPNAYFSECGLFSMVEARKQLVAALQR